MVTVRGVFDGASGAAVAALFVGAQTPLGHKRERERERERGSKGFQLWNNLVLWEQSTEHIHPLSYLYSCLG